jgi:hypothetical protein
VINLKTAKVLGLTAPLSLLGIADGQSGGPSPVCVWHKADIAIVLNHVRFRG